MQNSLARAMRRTLAGCALVAGIALVPAAQAQVAVDVDVTLTGITVLYYYNAINVDVPASALAASLCGPGGTVSNFGSGVTGWSACDVGTAGTLTASGSAGALSVNGNIATNAAVTGFSGTVNLTLQNVWSVRAVGGSSANTTLTIGAGASSTLTNGTSNIAITNPRLQSTGATGSPGTAITFPDPGLVTPRSGDVILTLNLTNATTAGTYSTTALPAGDTGDSNYILTVTGT